MSEMMRQKRIQCHKQNKVKKYERKIKKWQTENLPELKAIKCKYCGAIHQPREFLAYGELFVGCEK